MVINPSLYTVYYRHDVVDDDYYDDDDSEGGDGEVSSNYYNFLSHF